MDNIVNENDQENVRKLYQLLLTHWNNHDAAGFAGLFAREGNSIGFDGSQMNGQQQIN
ncbi:MAG: hypothetical protein JWP81_2261 [Ferruginibacter sp.]|nr:hypothetical protein [Ferruginibacter sp.]